MEESMEKVEQNVSTDVAESEAELELFKPRGFVKWAGSKRQLVQEIKSHIPSSWDSSRDLYCEPFVGSGALFWELRPSRAWLNDLNTDLMNVWAEVAGRVRPLIDSLSEMSVKYRKDSKAMYYAVRGWNVDSLNDSARAARFIFLNKACFNGLYRVNSRGEFNVSWGRNPKVNVLDAENLMACSNYLARTGPKLSSHDFAGVKPIPEGSLVYVDPPYSPVSKTSSFTGFTKENFGQKEHKRLAEWCAALAKRGVHVIVSQSAEESVVDLYRAEGFAAHLVGATRRINSMSYGRGPVGEYILVGGGA
jgi:DNA adenine methylase